MVQQFDLKQLVRPNVDATEDQIVAYADLALDCVKTPGTRRPDMKEVVRRLSTMMAELNALTGESSMRGYSMATAYEGDMGGSRYSAMTGGTSRTASSTRSGTSAMMNTSSSASLESEVVAKEPEPPSMRAELLALGINSYD